MGAHPWYDVSGQKLSPQQEARKEEVRKIIDDYTEREAGHVSINEDQNEEDQFDKLTAKDIILQPFEMEMLIKEGGERVTTTDFMDSNMMGQKSFLSTPKFIKALADLSDDLIGLPDQKTYLKNAL